MLYRFSYIHSLIEYCIKSLLKGQVSLFYHPRQINHAEDKISNVLWLKIVLSIIFRLVRITVVALKFFDSIKNILIEFQFVKLFIKLKHEKDVRIFHNIEFRFVLRTEIIPIRTKQ